MTEKQWRSIDEKCEKIINYLPNKIGISEYFFYYYVTFSGNCNLIIPYAGERMIKNVR